MKTILYMSFSLCLTLLSFANHADTQGKPSFERTKLAPGLHVLIGVSGFTGGNISLSIGDDGVVMVDDSMPPLLNTLKAAIATITEKPVDFLINTHVHRDHTGNNNHFHDTGSHIIAHKNMRMNMLNKGLIRNGTQQPAPNSMLPVVTFSDTMQLHLNNEQLNIIHMANAHTDGDAIIHYQNANVIHTGDIFFNGIFPFIDIANGGSIDGYIKAQQAIHAMADDQTVLIPGHGPIANKAKLRETTVMLIEVRDLINEAIYAGKTEAQVVAEKTLDKFSQDWSWSFITTEKMTRQVYRSLK